MKKSTILTFIVFLLASISSFAQEEQEQAPANLNAAFEELKDKSANYEQYQVVANSRLEAFWKQITDTLAAKESAINNARSEIRQLKSKIEEMEITMAEKDKKVEDSQYLVDHLTVLGISMSKNGYVYFNFFLILVLAAVIGIGFGRFKENERIASDKKKLAETAENALEDYKKKAKEKEMKLRRELQTEINKNEDLNKEIIQLKKKKTPQ